MSEEQLPPLMQLPNGVLIPTEELIIAIHDRIIKYRKELGKEDPLGFRDRGMVKHLCDTLTDRMHRYKKDPLENALYIATETFYWIACHHPFVEGNKSTAYISALTVLYANFSNNQKILPMGSSLSFELVDINYITAPKEAEEITKLAEAGKDDAELKRLIKEFLQNKIDKELRI